MIRLLFLSVVLLSSNVYAGDILYYVCAGKNPDYEVAALQQVVSNESGIVSSTFVLDVASSADEHVTRYVQNGDLILKSESINEEDSVVVGSFEKDRKEIGISIFYFWKTGYRVELSADGRVVKMPCKKKI